MWPHISFPISPSANTAHGSGLIHRTFLLGDKSGGKEQYILQRINTHVFGDLAAIEQNVQRAGNWLAEQQSDVLFVQPLVGYDGRVFQTDNEGTVWRLQRFVPDSESHEVAASAEMAHSAAQTYARLALALSGCPQEGFGYPIVEFHSIRKYADQLRSIIKVADIQRLRLAGAVIEQLNQHDGILQMGIAMHSGDEYPMRILHHDAKMSNVLFQRGTGTALCAIDLDTLMPGKIYSDLGDLIRSACCAVHEGDTERMDTEVRPHYVEAVMDGYQGVIDGILEQSERKNLPKAAQIMTYMQAIRFLADYLRGDTYYRTDYPTHNLVRAVQQCNLLRQL